MSWLSQALPAAGVTEAVEGQPYEIGIFAMRFDGSPDDYLAHAVVSAGHHDDAYVDFKMFSGETPGYIWAYWVAIELSLRRNSVAVVWQPDTGMQWEVYESKQYDQLSEELQLALEEPCAAPADMFTALVQASAPLISVWPVDDEFMRTLPDRAPPWPEPDADAEIAGLPRWQGQRMG